MRLHFTPHAVRDLTELADYIRAENPAAAGRARDAIYQILRNLLLFPKVGRQQMTQGVRRVVVRKYPYLIYYTLGEADDEIIILNIKHSSRERPHGDL